MIGWYIEIPAPVNILLKTLDGGLEVKLSLKAAHAQTEPERDVTISCYNLLYCNTPRAATARHALE